jgi:hypothetical protein
MTSAPGGFGSIPPFDLKGNYMKKKYSNKQLRALEREMRNPSRWEDADHTVTYKGPTSIRFSFETLKKLQAIAEVTQKPINRLVNEYVKPFVDSEFALLQHLK